MSNLKKETILDYIDVCKPLILLGLQKNIKKISTHLLTVLTISVIVQIERREEIKRIPGVMKRLILNDIENGGMKYVNAQYFRRKPV